MKTVGLFSIPLTKVEDAILFTGDEINFINSTKYVEKANNNLFTEDYNILNSLPSINSQLEKILNNYCNSVLGFKNNELYITNSWCVKTPKGGYHPKHSHPNSIISGVLYIDVGTENQYIVFENEAQVFKKFNFLIDKNDNEYNTNRLSIEIKSKELILFPSWLEHEVPENKTNTTRLILGFNTFLKGKMGNNVYPTELNI